MTKQKITPFLWFDKGKAKEAAEFYTSVFINAKIINQWELANTLSGTVEIFTIELFGQEFTLMGTGPVVKCNESISFFINCKDQEEIDYYWEKLSAVPESEQCGWCKDKFGIYWQINPENIGDLIKTDKAAQAMLSMKKISIADLEKANRG